MLQRKNIWISEDGEHEGNVKVDVDVETDGEYKIIKIKTIDEDGNEKIEVKKIKTSGKKMIIISEDDEKQTKKKKKEKEKKKKSKK